MFGPIYMKKELSYAQVKTALKELEKLNQKKLEKAGICVDSGNPGRVRYRYHCERGGGCEVFLLIYSWRMDSFIL